MLRIVYIHMFKQLGVCVCAHARTHLQISLSLKKKQHSERVTYVPWELEVLTVHPVLYCSIWNAISSFVSLFIQITFRPSVVMPPCAKLELSLHFFLYLLRTYFFFFGVLFTCLSSVYISSDLALLWFHSVIKTPSPKGREEWCWSSHSSCHLCSMTSHTDSHANRSKRKGRKGVNACLNSPRSKSNQNSSKCNILLAVFCFFGLPAPLRLSMLFFLSFW